MPEEKKVRKKVPVKRRASARGTIKVQRAAPSEAVHVVNLRHEPMNQSRDEVYSPAIITPPQTLAPRWSFKAYRRIALPFVILVVLALGAVGYFALVRLDITVVPKVNAVEANTSFSVYDRPESYELPPSSIYGMVRESDAEYSQTYPATGGEITGAEVSGTVTIVNNYIKDQPLVATTRLLTSNNQLLRLKDTVLVPAGGSIEVEVYGETADPSFTLTDTRLTIPGLWAGLQDKIYAEAKAGAVSYREIKKTTVTQQDLDTAASEAKKALLENVDKNISTTYADYDQRLYQVDDQSIVFSFDAKVGEEKKEFTITISAKVSVVAFKNSAIGQLGDSTLQAALAKGQTIIDQSAITPTFTLSAVDTQNNIAEIKLLASAQATTAGADSLIDREKLIGLTESQIQSYLNSLDTIESYELHFRPGFLKIAPQLADRIVVTVK